MGRLGDHVSRSFWRHLDPVNTSFLIFAHAAALTGVVLYFTALPWSWRTFSLALAWHWLCSVSITGGYHRLFAHCSYKASSALKLLYLCFGAASVQNSALKWSADHRRHHLAVDTDRDPYSIRKGFLWAHVGWILFKDDAPQGQGVPDLMRDRLVKLQHRFYVPLALLFGLIAPVAIAALWGDAWGGFFLVCWIRLIVQWHSTFAINSVAHSLGTQPYSNTDTSRDSLLTALVTLGEGYHNYHHAFPGDYRNGVRLFQFDPTKWWVRGLSWLRLTWDLRQVSQERILRARLATDLRRLRERIAQGALAARAAALPSWEETLLGARERVERQFVRWQGLRRQYAQTRRELGQQARTELARLAQEARATRDEFNAAYRQWCAFVRRPELLLAA